MKESDQQRDEQARRALEAFTTDNADLDRLERLLAQFNIFEAVGVVRHEVRHSDFLAYLLSPQENHGLGAAFVKVLLRKVSADTGSADLAVVLAELDAWDMESATVLREWQHIDIFLRDELHRLVVIIENKIDTGEHDDQLSRYYAGVRREFPNDRIVALYLTKEGDAPTDDRYLPIGYKLVCEAIENLLEVSEASINPDVMTLMTHYAQMLRRHIISDTEIARLCGQIYQKHRMALDLIYECRPDRQTRIMEWIQELLEQKPSFRVGPVRGRGRWVGFGLAEWPDCLYLLFDNSPAGSILWMVIGDGEPDVRRRLFDFASQHQPPFVLDRSTINSRNTRIFSRIMLTAAEFEGDDSREQEETLRRRWLQFLEQDLSLLRRLLAEAAG